MKKTIIRFCTFLLLLFSMITVSADTIGLLGTYHSGAVTSPQNGSIWVYGLSENIQWDPSSITGTTVDIFLLGDDPSTILNEPPNPDNVKKLAWGLIANDIPNNGNYTILNPQNLNSHGNAYKFLVRSNTLDWGVSQGMFTLTDDNLGQPYKPITPTPVNNATGISTTQVLSWANGGGATSYNVYFGTDSIPDSGESKGTITSTSYNPGTLDYSKKYYWRIDSKNTAGTITGNTWSFTTGSAPPPATYPISYNANNSTSGSAPASQTKTQDVALTLRTNTGNMARTGYTFDGWNTNSSGTGSSYAAGSTYTNNSPITLYAKWTPDTYTINYDSNNATRGSVPDAQTKTHDVPLTLRANTGNLVKTGYTFSGWSTDPGETGISYTEGDTYHSNGNATLYAKWLIKPQNVSMPWLPLLLE